MCSVESVGVTIARSRFAYVSLNFSYALEDEEMPINLKYVRNIRMGLGLKQDDEVELDRYYEEATANLRSEAPSLHFITFYDGYSYFAESPGNNVRWLAAARVAATSTPSALAFLFADCRASARRDSFS